MGKVLRTILHPRRRGGSPVQVAGCLPESLEHPRFGTVRQASAAFLFLGVVTDFGLLAEGHVVLAPDCTAIAGACTKRPLHTGCRGTSSACKISGQRHLLFYSI